MLTYLRPRDLDPIAALAAAAIIIFAIFAWTVNTDLADPNDLSVAGWGWKLWQIGPLVMGFAGAWWFWLSTRRVAWVRCLVLAVLALAVFINGYTGLSGDYWGDVWRTVNPLFIASCSVAAVALWRCGCPAGKVGAFVTVILGAVVFANAYFVNNGILWQILDPVRMLTELSWAAIANKANTAPANTAPADSTE
jgi:hypothetical protein